MADTYVMEIPGPQPITLPEAFTCISCHLLFEDGNVQREHYRSDVHRFNLKRKVAGLAPVTPQVYESKQNALKEAEKAKEATANVVAECTACAKKFHSDAQLQQHLLTKKHKLNESKGSTQRPSKPSSDANSEVSSSSSSIQAPQLTEEQAKSMTDEEIYEWRLKNSKRLDLTDCLFCKNKSPTLKSNLRHMSVEHSFFIPDIEYLTDLEGLIKYLGEKISVGWTCLYCNGAGKSFQSMEAVQAHMCSLSHCKILYEEEEQEEEFSDFYDFTEYYKSRGMDPEKGAEELKQNEFGELILSSNNQKQIVIGHRDLKPLYKKQRATSGQRDNALIQSLVSEYRAMALKRDQMAKLPPSKDIRRENSLQLRIGQSANRIVRLRFRSDCPI